MLVKGMVSVPLVSGVDESTVTIKLVNNAEKMLARLAETSINMLFGVPATGPEMDKVLPMHKNFQNPNVLYGKADLFN